MPKNRCIATKWIGWVQNASTSSHKGSSATKEGMAWQEHQSEDLPIGGLGVVVWFKV